MLSTIKSSRNRICLHSSLASKRFSELNDIQYKDIFKTLVIDVINYTSYFLANSMNKSYRRDSKMSKGLKDKTHFTAEQIGLYYQKLKKVFKF